MKKNCPAEFIEFANQLADLAGNAIRPYYRSAHGLKAKEDKSPVTMADLEAERQMRAAIEKKYPEHGIIGEEFGNTRLDSDYIWTLDPIDGTASFMIGRPIFGTLISLLYQGTPILGIIDQPISKERWLGVNGQTSFEDSLGVRTYVRTCQEKRLIDSVICTSSREYFLEQDGKFFDKVRSKAKYAVYGGDCYSYGLVSLGQADIVIESGLKIHDFCALRPIIEGAGGSFIDWQGKEIDINSDGRVIAAGSKELVEEILNLLPDIT